MADIVKINFPPRQKLPPGYRVEWWASDEHYHWVIDEDTYSQIFANRYQARRAAWAHYFDGLCIEETNKSRAAQFRKAECCLNCGRVKTNYVHLGADRLDCTWLKDRVYPTFVCDKFRPYET